MSQNNNQNEMQQDGHHDQYVRSISEAASPEAIETIEFYRAAGILGAEMGILQEYPGGPEKVTFSKYGLMRVAKSSLGGFGAIDFFNKVDLPLTLEDELYLIGCDSGEVDPIEYFAGVNEIRQSMTLAGLRQMRRDAAIIPGVCCGLGTKSYRDYINGEVERLGNHYGWDTRLNDVEMCKDAHAIAVILNSFSIGDADMEGLEDLEEQLCLILRKYAE